MKRAFKYPLYLIATLLVLVVITSVAIRLFLSDISEYRDLIVSVLEQNIDREISIGDLNAHLEGLDLLIEVGGLKVASADTANEPISVHKLHLEIDGLASLISMSPIIQRFYVEARDLSIVNLLNEVGTQSSAKGLLSLALNGELVDGKMLFNNLNGNIVIKDFTYQDVKINELSSNVVLEKELSRSQLGLIDLSLDSPLASIENMKIRLVQESTDKNAHTEISLQTDTPIAFSLDMSNILNDILDQYLENHPTIQVQQLRNANVRVHIAHNLQWVIGSQQWVLPTTMPEIGKDLQITDTFMEIGLRQVTINDTNQLDTVDMSFQGDILKPLSSKNKLSISSQLVDNDITYKNNLPILRKVNAEVSMDAKSLVATIKSAELLSTRVTNAEIEVKDWTKPYLHVMADAEGPFQDVFQYLTQLPFKSLEGKLNNIKTEGDVDTHIKLGIPLNEETKKTKRGEFVVQIDMDENTFALGNKMPPLKQLEGQLVFSQQGGKAEAISGELLGHPVIINAQPQSGATQFELIAQSVPSKTISHITKLPSHLIDGSVDSRVIVFVPSFVKKAESTKESGKDNLHLTISSNLKGLKFNLPQPLGKSANQAIPFHYEVPLNVKNAHSYMKYGDVLQMKTSQNKGQLTGILQFSPTASDRRMLIDKSSGFRVRGNIKELPIDEWGRWWKKNKAIAKDDKKNNRDIALPLNDVNIVVGSLSLGDGEIKNLGIITRKNEQHLAINLDSKDLAGKIIIPNKGEKRHYIDLERLHLEQSLESTQTTSPSELNPQDLPPLVVKIKRLQLGQAELDNFKLLVNPQTQGVEIALLRFEHQYKGKSIMRARATGNWIQDEDGLQKSALDFTVVGSDYGRLFKRWGYSTGFREARGSVKGEVAWDDAFHHFNIAKLKGDIYLKIKDGRLRTVETGAGRLLGLLNIRTILKRLTLDFRDVFKTGFSFKSFRGHLEFTSGNMNADNLILKSNSLNMSINGRTGITARDYDQVIDVVPKFSSSIPWATVLLGGPIAGAVALVIDKASDLGKKINKALTLRYTMKGTWEEPKVEFVKAPTVDKFNPGKKLKKLFDDIGDTLRPSSKPK